MPTAPAQMNINRVRSRGNRTNTCTNLAHINLRLTVQGKSTGNTVQHTLLHQLDGATGQLLLRRLKNNAHRATQR